MKSCARALLSQNRVVFAYLVTLSLSKSLRLLLELCISDSLRLLLELCISDSLRLLRQLGTGNWRDGWLGILQFSERISRTGWLGTLQLKEPICSVWTMCRSFLFSTRSNSERRFFWLVIGNPLKIVSIDFLSWTTSIFVSVIRAFRLVAEMIPYILHNLYYHQFLLQTFWLIFLSFLLCFLTFMSFLIL